MPAKPYSYYTELEDLMLEGKFGSSVDTLEEQALVDAFQKAKFEDREPEARQAISLKMPVSILASLKKQAKEDAIPYQTILISLAKKWTE